MDSAKGIKGHRGPPPPSLGQGRGRDAALMPTLAQPGWQLLAACSHQAGAVKGGSLRFPRQPRALHPPLQTGSLLARHCTAPAEILPGLVPNTKDPRLPSVPASQGNRGTQHCCNTEARSIAHVAQTRRIAISVWFSLPTELQAGGSRSPSPAASLRPRNKAQWPEP